MKTDDLYRPGVGIVLLNADSQVFVGQRLDVDLTAWQMPQGGIEPGEDPKTAALRELHEEVGTRNIDFIDSINEWLYYDLPEVLVPQFWSGKYRGQKHMWFLCRFLGTDDEININTANPEFKTWKWIDYKLLPELIVPFKRDMYVDIVSRFEPTIKKIAATNCRQTSRLS